MRGPRVIVDRALRALGHAAREADIDRKYFRKLMKKYEIEALGTVGADEPDDD